MLSKIYFSIILVASDFFLAFQKVSHVLQNRAIRKKKNEAIDCNTDFIVQWIKGMQPRMEALLLHLDITVLHHQK